MLKEERRKQLDDIVGKMVINKESDSNIQFVVKDFSQKYAGESDITQNPQQQADQVSAQQFKPSFPARTGESALMAGAKTLGNMPSSSVGFVKGAINMFNPIETAKKVAQIPGAIYETAKTPGVDMGLKSSVKNLATAGYETLVPQFFQNLLSGNLEEARRTITNDPVGQLAPVLLTGKALADKMGVGKQFDSVMTKVASPIAKPLTSAGKAIKKTAGNVAKFGISQETGLNPSTVSEIVKNPEQFSKENITNTNRQTIASGAKKAIETRLSSLQETGKGYETIRQGQSVANIPPDLVSNVLAKRKIELKNGKLNFTKESLPMSAGDKAALQNFVDMYGKETELSGNAILNARTELSNMAKFDATKTGSSEILAKDLRKAYDGVAKNQIQGLAELDFKYSPEVNLLKQIKKDYFKPDGDFKDGAVNKIANLTGKGKDQILGRLEKIDPGISKKITILKAIEDIEASKGIKVGTYTRGGTVAGGAVLGGIPGAVIATILTSPDVIIPVLRGYGSLIKLSDSVINKMVDKINKGASFDLKELNIFKKSIENWKKPWQTTSQNISSEINEPYSPTRKNNTNSSSYTLSTTGGNGAPFTTSMSKTSSTGIDWKQAEKDAKFYIGETPFKRGNLKINDIHGTGLKKSETINPNADLNKPIIVNKVGNKYQLIDGRNRIEQLKNKGVDNVNAIIADKTAKTSLPLKSNPLIQEAKKYKTAEEFVNSLGKQKYEPTSEYFQSKGLKKELADYASLKASEMMDMKSPTILDIIEGKFKQFITGERGKGNITIYRAVPKGEKINMSDMVFTDKKMAVEFQNEYGFKRGQQEIVSQKINGEDILLLDPKRFSGEAIYFPKAMDSIKTKSQLTDIWNKANKKQPILGLPK